MGSVRKTRRLRCAAGTGISIAVSRPVDAVIDFLEAERARGVTHVALDDEAKEALRELFRRARGGSQAAKTLPETAAAPPAAAVVSEIYRRRHDQGRATRLAAQTGGNLGTRPLVGHAARDDGIRHRQSGRAPDAGRRGTRPRGGAQTRTLRRARGTKAHRHPQGHGSGARRGLHFQHRQVPPGHRAADHQQPQALAGGNGRLPALHPRRGGDHPAGVHHRAGRHRGGGLAGRRRKRRQPARIMA